MHNKRFLFLVAWLHGSFSAQENGDITNVSDQSDLYPQYQEGNESVYVAEIFAPNAAVADAVGWRYAMTEDLGGYTLHDTVSTVIEISEDEKLIPHEYHVAVFRYTVTEDGITEEETGG